MFDKTVFALTLSTSWVLHVETQEKMQPKKPSVFISV